MKPGSIVVDLAVEQGGNCSLSVKDKAVVQHGVTLIGYSNLPAMLPADASALYARNVLSFVNLLLDPKTGELKLNRNDEIIAGALICIDGSVVPAA
jgi:NAD(P) transhydrogenase subunit alpha